MKGAFSFIFIIFFLFNSCKNNENLNPNLKKEFWIKSSFKERDYRIWVYLPEGYNANAEEYASIYVLDPDDACEGDSTNITFVAKKCHTYSKKYNKRNVVVFGIRQGDYREIDYTPTAYTVGGLQGEGGANKFLSFIEKELFDTARFYFNVSKERSKRAILGHSLGGLCGSYAFTAFPNAFGNYLLLSPSLIYDNDIILQYEQKERQNLIKNKNLVFLAAGSTEPNMLPSINTLNERIKKYYTSTNSLLYISPGRGHNSSKVDNIENALDFYFKNQ